MFKRQKFGENEELYDIFKNNSGSLQISGKCVENIYI